MRNNIIIILFIILGVNTICTAQDSNVARGQKEKELKCMMQQIAALQTYIAYLQKGYAIAKDGLTFIGDLKDGEFSMHKNYFNSLKKVNSAVSKYAKVGDIIVLQKAVGQIYHKRYAQVQTSDVFTPDELKYINAVYTRLLKDCNSTIDELTAITTNNNLEMKDRERLDRIDALYIKTLDQYTFVNSFGNETVLMAAFRVKEKSDVETSGILNGTK